MIVELSIIDALSLMGSDAKSLRKDLDRHPLLKEIFHKKETYTTEYLHGSGMAGHKYIADCLEGKASVADTPEVIFDKLLKLGYVRKSNRDESIMVFKEMPVYLLVNITNNSNKELGIKQ